MAPTRPIARPTASPRDARTISAEAASRSVSAATPRTNERVARLSPRQLTRLASDLTSLDRQLLDYVAQTRVCSGSQIQRLCFGSGEASGRAARRALRRLSTWNVLGVLPGRIGGVRAGSAGYAYYVGPVGARILQAEGGPTAKRLVAPGERFIRHTLAITEAFVRLHEAQEQKALRLNEIETEPRCWRAFTGPMGAPITLKPDLLVAVAAGDGDEDR